MRENHGNIRATWNVLNKAMRPNSNQKQLPDHFIEKDVVLNNSKTIANEFNLFFTNIGAKIANSITSIDKTTFKMSSRVMQSMFLGDISEHEILAIVMRSKNKTSTDSNELDMAIIKRTIDCIVKPFTYICNLSLKTGIFSTANESCKSNSHF